MVSLCAAVCVQVGGAAFLLPPHRFKIKRQQTAGRTTHRVRLVCLREKPQVGHITHILSRRYAYVRRSPPHNLSRRYKCTCVETRQYLVWQPEVDGGLA